MSPGQMFTGQMSLWKLESVLDVPSSLCLKFHQNRVSNSWDIADIVKVELWLSWGFDKNLWNYWTACQISQQSCIVRSLHFILDKQKDIHSISAKEKTFIIFNISSDIEKQLSQFFLDIIYETNNFWLSKDSRALYAQVLLARATVASVRVSQIFSTEFESLNPFQNSFNRIPSILLYQSIKHS